MHFLFSERRNHGSQPGIFMDRDGVINRRIQGGYVTTWKEFEFIPGIKEALVELSQLNIPLVIVSNQACVEKGLLAPDALRDITRRFVAALDEVGARVDAVYYCPHAPERGCACRKPSPGLLKLAAEQWHLELDRSVLIGDSPSDIQAAFAVKCHSVLLASLDEGPPPVGLPGTAIVRAAAQIPGRVYEALQLSQRAGA